MADLKTTNIYGDAYINNKVGINTNTPATRLQIGQLSPTAATEGLQFGDDTGARMYRSAASTISIAGNFNASSGTITSTYGGFSSPGLILGDAQYGFYVASGNLYYKSAAGGNHYWRNIANNATTLALDNSGNLTALGNISAANLSGTNTGDQTVGNGTITIAAGTGIGVGTSNTFTTNQSGATTVTVTNNGVTSNVAGTGISVSGATGAVTITNSGVTSAVAGTGVSVSAATGTVTFSIGQAVGTGNTPSFAGLVSSAVTNYAFLQVTDTNNFWITPGNNNWGLYFETSAGGLLGGTGDSNRLGFVGSGTARFYVDLNNGNGWFGGNLTATNDTVTGATMTYLTGAYQNTTVYDSPRTQSATPSRGIRAPASSIQFTDSYAIAPYYTYRSTGDWPVPYGIGWGTGGESSGIFQRYASNGYSFGDMIFYTGNDGYGAFSFRRHTWEGTTYFAAGSGELNTELFRIDWTGKATATSFALPGGFTISDPGSGYAAFNNWVQLGTTGFYSSTNNAHFYPNNGTYGSWRIAGTRNSWYGIEFDSGTCLMTNSSEVGFYRLSYGWQMRWYAGTGYIYKGNPGGGTEATILDTSNASYAWNMNQNVRTTDSPTFVDLFISGLQIRSGSPTITLRDTDHRTGFIHVNSNIFYILTGGTDVASGNWSIVANSRWPLEINLSNNNATFGGDVNAISFTGAGTGLTGTASSLTAGAVTNGFYTTGGQTIAGITYFSNGESINLYGIRGRFTNEYIHLYNKVGVGHPGGWGQGESSTPDKGLSTYGGLNIAYGDNALSTFNGVIRVNSNIRQGADLARPLASWSVAGTSTGMVIFSFPGNTGNYGMVHCVFDIYEYNSNTVSTVIVGGHNWNGAWYNFGANVIGRCGKSVRLGTKDSKYCVVFGGAASSWEYGTIILRKIHNGGFYTGIMDMGGTFTTQQTTTESFSNISGDLRLLRTSADFIADGGVTGTSFTGAGTGLTGTAASLSIGGNAATATNVTWTGITQSTRTNYDLAFQPPSSGYAGFSFKTSAGGEAGYFLVRGTSDSDVYTAEGITLVADGGWLTLAQRTTASRGVRIMTGTTSSERLKITTAGDIQFVNGNSITYNGNVVLHAGNYNSYSPTLTGTGASGTWAINVTGNAATATTLQTARAINGVSFNGSAAITVNGLNYNINDNWLRENGDDAQFQMYGNSRTMIYRTDGTTNPHGGGAYAHIFYYGGSADGNRTFIINTDGRLWSPYHGWLDTMNVASATNLSTTRANWSTNGTITAVVGQLSWKNYGNGHTIFDASAATSPATGAISNTNPDYAWAATYPTLMGWNGANTYGVRVDSSRYSDQATTAVVNASNTSAGWYPIVWHSGNTLYSTANVLLWAQNGYIQANYFNSSDDVSSGNISYIMAKFGDGYLRSATAAKVAAFISNQTMSIQGSSTSCSGNAATVTNGVYTTGAQSISGVKTFSDPPVAVNIAKAWVHFNGTGTVAINTSYNVSSITDNGVGDYTVNFTSAFVDANYVVAGTSNLDYTNNSSNYNVYLSVPRQPNAQQAGSCRLATEYPAGVGLYDCVAVRAVFFR